jgi:CheY-like chemotaxis protein
MNELSTILLAEDDDGHASLVERNLKRIGISDEIYRVRDGQEAIDYVCRAGQFVARAPSYPRLILLDINMPRLDGVEVLRYIKTDESTKTIPVVMFTTTDDGREIDRCYELGCNAYIRKPVEYGGFVGIIKSLGSFLQILSTPSHSSITATPSCGSYMEQ